MSQALFGTIDTLPSTEEGLLHTFDEIRVKLFRSLYAMLGNYDDAQDALQVAFLRCWQARASLCGLRNVKAWVWRVSLNAGRDLRDRIRIRRGKPLSDIDSVASTPGGSPADVLVRREQQERLQTALKRLRPEENEVFLLRQNESLTYEEIAQRRGTPVSTGKTLMRSAVRKLRRQLHESGTDRGRDWPAGR
jgi:RNA polymerase sigma-70 factor (ECF subfamily)